MMRAPFALAVIVLLMSACGLAAPVDETPFSMLSCPVLSSAVISAVVAISPLLTILIVPVPVLSPSILEAIVPP